MAQWQLAVDLRGGSEQPIFIRLARAISDDVRRGRLKPGDALPGSRTLARTLGVHRNTVLAAYAELAAEGWITTAATAPAALGFDLPSRRDARPRPDLSPAANVLAMSGGIPDVRLVPAAPLA